MAVIPVKKSSPSGWIPCPEAHDSGRNACADAIGSVLRTSESQRLTPIRKEIPVRFLGSHSCLRTSSIRHPGRAVDIPAGLEGRTGLQADDVPVTESFEPAAHVTGRLQRRVGLESAPRGPSSGIEAEARATEQPGALVSAAGPFQQIPKPSHSRGGIFCQSVCGRRPEPSRWAHTADSPGAGRLAHAHPSPVQGR